MAAIKVTAQTSFGNSTPTHERDASSKRRVLRRFVK